MCIRKKVKLPSKSKSGGSSNKKKTNKRQASPKGQPEQQNPTKQPSAVSFKPSPTPLVSDRTQCATKVPSADQVQTIHTAVPLAPSRPAMSRQDKPKLKTSAETVTMTKAPAKAFAKGPIRRRPSAQSRERSRGKKRESQEPWQKSQYSCSMLTEQFENAQQVTVTTDLKKAFGGCRVADGEEKEEDPDITEAYVSHGAAAIILPPILRPLSALSLRGNKKENSGKPKSKKQKGLNKKTAVSQKNRKTVSRTQSSKSKGRTVRCEPHRK